MTPLRRELLGDGFHLSHIVKGSDGRKRAGATGVEPVGLYPRRRELNSALDGLRTLQFDPRVVLCSRAPDGVHQEAWGQLATHHAIRRLMRAAALQADLIARGYRPGPLVEVAEPERAQSAVGVRSQQARVRASPRERWLAGGTARVASEAATSLSVLGLRRRGETFAVQYCGNIADFLATGAQSD